MAATPEHKVKQKIKDWLNAHGAYWYMVVPAGYSRAGVPDFIVCLPSHGGVGIFVGIEAKAPGKRSNTSPHQKRELSWIQRAGGISLVVDDVDQVEQALGGLIRETTPGQSETDSQST